MNFEPAHPLTAFLLARSVSENLLMMHADDDRTDIMRPTWLRHAHDDFRKLAVALGYEIATVAPATLEAAE